MSERAWGNYWSTGLTSCFPKDSTADKQLKLIWEKAISHARIPENSSLLELGCGNGFLTSIIINALEGRNFTLNAMDYSKVQLNDLLCRADKKLKVFDETTIEEMPFEAGSMDVLFSNFAFEYAEPKKAVIETSRVLKSGGCFLYNVHSKLSFVTGTSDCIINALDNMLKNEDLYLNIKKVISLKLESTSEDNKKNIFLIAKEIIDELKKIDVSSKGGITNSGVIEDILPLIKTSNENISLLRLENMWQNYALYKIRIEQQLSVGYEPSEINDIVDVFSEVGIQMTFEPVFIEGKVFSYMLSGVKS